LITIDNLSKNTKEGEVLHKNCPKIFIEQIIKYKDSKYASMVKIIKPKYFFHL